MALHDGGFDTTLSLRASLPRYDGVAEAAGEIYSRPSNPAPAARDPNTASYGGEDQHDRKTHDYFKKQREAKGIKDDKISDNSAFFRHPETGEVIFGLGSEERRQIMIAAASKMEKEKQNQNLADATDEARDHFKRKNKAAGRDVDSPSTDPNLVVNYKTGKLEYMSADERERHDSEMRAAYDREMADATEAAQNVEVAKYFARKDGRKYEPNTDSEFSQDPITGELTYGQTAEQIRARKMQAYLQWHKETDGGKINSLGHRTTTNVLSIKMHKLNWGNMAS